MTWTLRLPIDAVPWRTMNSRQHWSMRHADTQAVHWATKQALRNVDEPIPPLPAKCTVTMRPKTRRIRDADNALACVKPVMDYLVMEGLLPDDSWRQIPTWQVTVDPDPDDPGWTIELEPA